MAVQATCIACVTPSVPMNLRENVSARALNTLGITWDQGFNNGAAGVYYTIHAEWEENGVVQFFNSAQDATNIVDRTFFMDQLTVGTTYKV